MSDNSPVERTTARGPVQIRRFNIEPIAAVFCLWVYFLRYVEITSSGTPYLARHSVSYYIGEFVLLTFAAGLDWSAIRRRPRASWMISLLVRNRSHPGEK